MEAVLGGECFAGPAVDRVTAALSFAGQAAFNGCIAVCSWPRAEVAALLPPELVLAGGDAPGRERHPVVFVFGEHTEGATLFGGLTFALGVDYHEFALAVPFVRHRAGRFLHTFVPRMYASFFPAAWAGNTHYGLAKAMATMGWHGPQFVITAPDGALLLHASIEAAGAWQAAALGAWPALLALRQAFALPIAGRRNDGSYVASYFGWDFTEALVRPIDAAVAIDAPLVDGITPRWCSALDAGAFEVRRMLWRLSWPGPCRF
jgi:hypothetical protein